ncbi:hypothetical protein D3C78_1770740 [compost metagenome]
MEPQLQVGGQGIVGGAEHLVEARGLGMSVAKGAERFDDCHGSLIRGDALSYHAEYRSIGGFGLLAKVEAVGRRKQGRAPAARPSIFL